MTLLHLAQPFIPHFAEEVWQQCGHHDTLAFRPWPKADPALCVEEEITIAVQVNGKLRATATAATGRRQGRAGIACLGAEERAGFHRGQAH